MHGHRLSAYILFALLVLILSGLSKVFASRNSYNLTRSQASGIAKASLSVDTARCYEGQFIRLNWVARFDHKISEPHDPSVIAVSEACIVLLDSAELRWMLPDRTLPTGLIRVDTPKERTYQVKGTTLLTYYFCPSGSNRTEMPVWLPAGRYRIFFSDSLHPIKSDTVSIFILPAPSETGEFLAHYQVLCRSQIAYLWGSRLSSQQNLGISNRFIGNWHMTSADSAQAIGILRSSHNLDTLRSHILPILDAKPQSTYRVEALTTSIEVLDNWRFDCSVSEHPDFTSLGRRVISAYLQEPTMDPSKVLHYAESLIFPMAAGLALQDSLVSFAKSTHDNAIMKEACTRRNRFIEIEDHALKRRLKDK